MDVILNGFSISLKNISMSHDTKENNIRLQVPLLSYPDCKFRVVAVMDV